MDGVSDGGLLVSNPDSVREALQAEVDSWLLSDAERQTEKLLRERIRHHKLVRDLLLDKLPTSTWDIAEVGGGPLPVSDLIPFRTRVVIDPLSDSYKKIAPCPDHVAIDAETCIDASNLWDLVIATNSLDHTADPSFVARAISCAVRPGGFVAIVSAINNAITHPHQAHHHNLTPELVWSWFAYNYELVWDLTYERDNYRYGHVLYEGRRGQPAFAMLLRRCSGYG